MDPVIIIDNVFSENHLENFEKQVKDFNKQGEWFNWDKYGDTNTYCWILINRASTYYDISRLRGYEVWTHHNTKPAGDLDGGSHYDKDEYRWANNKVLSFPVCSLVFYLQAENVVNGELIVKDISIKPKRNRLVIFGPGNKHRVKDFQGNRFSVNINPWNRKLEEYN